MRIPSITNLLHQVSAINRTQEKLDLLSGDKFNVFRILGLHEKEVRTHSAFIGELLNPRGCHGLKSRFLKLFLEVLRIHDFEAEKASVSIEKYAGPIDENYLEGGRIDIYIRDQSGRFIFIENKIYAADQHNQLFRYHRYESGAILFYLTLDGSEPSDWSTGKLLPEQYRLCSYRREIVQWLELCHKEAAAHPVIRETITQYLNLVSSLAGNVPSDFMKEDVKRLLLHNQESFESAGYLAEIIQEIKAETVVLLDGEFHSSWFKVFKDDLCPLANYSIRFSWHKDFFGFVAARGGVENVSLDKPLIPFVELVKQVHPKFKNNSYWVGWKYFVKKSPAFDALPLETLFIMANDAEARTQLIEEIIEEAKPHYMTFKKLLTAYKRANRS